MEEKNIKQYSMSFRMDPELYQKLDQYCKKWRISKSGAIQNAIEYYFKHVVNEDGDENTMGISK